MTGLVVIAGLGVVLSSRDEHPDATSLATRAAAEALADAGRQFRDVDALLVARNELVAADRLGLDLARRAPFGSLKHLYETEAKGTTTSLLVEQASRMVAAGEVETAMVVFSDAAIAPTVPAGQAFASMGGGAGYRGLERAGGMLGAVAAYALLAQHYCRDRGAVADDLFTVAQTQRTWAAGNPLAWAREPLTREQYDASPLVVAPFRRFDCARPVSGAAAFVVTRSDGTSERAEVRVAGSGHRHAPRRRHRGGSPWKPQGARPAFEQALAQAGRSADDLDLLQVYDAFTVVPLIMLEEVGLVPPGGAGRFYADGEAAPGGRLPVNTGGGMISGYYLQGATPLVEAVTQLRGAGGARQVHGAATCMVVSIGGRLESVSALLLEAVT